MSINQWQAGYILPGSKGHEDRLLRDLYGRHETCAVEDGAEHTKIIVEACPCQSGANAFYRAGDCASLQEDGERGREGEKMQETLSVSSMRRIHCPPVFLA